MRKAHKVKRVLPMLTNAFRKVEHHKAFKHSHHAAYVLYYGIAILTERGLMLAIGGALFASAVVVMIAGANDVDR